MKLFGPMQMPRPPSTSMPSLTTSRMYSVVWYLRMAEATDGSSPLSRAAQVRLRALGLKVGEQEKLAAVRHGQTVQWEQALDAPEQ